MLKRPHSIAAGLVVLLTLTILNLPSRTADRLKLAISSLFLPLFGVSSSSQQVVEKTGGALASRGELLAENENLRRENQQLRIQAMRAEETARENSRLWQLLGWQQTNHWGRPKLARVVGHDPANWWRGIYIDRGSRDGVRANLPVVTTDGLVGRVSGVGFAHAQVVLLGDANCKVPAMIEDTRESGVTGVSGPFETSLVPLEYLSKNANLKPGQKIVTSGAGEVFPKGIPIGKVVDAHPVEYGLVVQARIKPAANLLGLEEVWVLLP
jgi:rod shape-determining protein MreC